MEFEYDWLTLSRHRIRLRSTKGFPTETMRTAVEVIRLAIDSNMSARARLVEVVFRQESAYEIAVGTTFADDRLCAPQLEAAIATVLGLQPAQINILVTVEPRTFDATKHGVPSRIGLVRQAFRACASNVASWPSAAS